MVLYFTDRQLHILGFASSALPDGLRIIDDIRTDDITTGTSSFTAVIHCKEPEQWELAAPGRLCARVADDEVKVYQVIETTADSENNTTTIDCEDAGLQLLGHLVDAVNELQPHGADWYLANALTGTAFTSGGADFSDTAALSLSEGTCVERILAIAEAFDAEPVYSYEIDQTGGQVTALVSLRKKGRLPARHTWRVGYEIRRLETKASATGAATDILARGAVMPEGGQITLKNYPGWADITDTDENGNVIDTITLNTTTGVLHSAAAAERWGATITRLYEGTATTQAGLLTEALTDLRVRREEAREFGLELVTAGGAAVGDYVNIVDDKRNIYAEARIVTLSRNTTQNTWAATVGEIIRKTSGISARLEALAAKLENGGLDGKDAYLHIAYANSADGQTGFSTTDPTGRAYLGQYTDSNPAASTNPADYTWQQTKGEQGQQGQQGTPGANGTDGADALAMSIESSAGFAFVNEDPAATLTAHVFLGAVELAAAGIAALGTISWTKDGAAAGTGATLVITAVGTYKATLAANGATLAFAEVSVTRVDDVNSLTPEETFNALTDGGQIQGIFRDATTGDLYVNMSYIRTGKLTAGGYNDNRGVIDVVDSDGYNLIEINNGGIYMYNPPSDPQAYPYGPIVGQLSRGGIVVSSGTSYNDLTGAHLQCDGLAFYDANGQQVADFYIHATQGPMLRLDSLKVLMSGANAQVSVSGNVSASNIIASGYVSATGNIQTSGNIMAASGRVTAAQLTSTGKVIATGDITTRGAMQCQAGLKVGGQIDGEAVPGLIQFVRASVTVNGGTVQPGDYVVLNGANGTDVIDFSASIPTGYEVQMVSWITANDYIYFAPTALILATTKTYATARIRNLGTAAHDLTSIDLMLVCTRTAGYTPT